MCRQKTSTFLLLPALAIPVAIHFTLLFLYTVNAPQLDDFSEILTFLPDWHAAATTQEKLAVFFRDYQNHRYVLYHALLVLFDAINFRSAAIVGNLALPVLCSLLMFATRQHPQRYVIWLITPWLIFNLQAGRAMFWGPLGTTNLLYPTVALLACLLATGDTPKLATALLVCLALTLSHGSGPLLFPVIALYLWQKHGAAAPATRYWLLLSALVWLGYFVLFPLQGEAGYSSHSTTELLGNFLQNSLTVAQGWLALFGSALLTHTPAGDNEILAALLGALELAGLLWLIRRGALRQQPALLCWLLFLLLTGLGIASGRVAYAGVAQALQGHYKLLNGIVLWLLAAATLDWLTQQHPRCLLVARPACIVITLALYLLAWQLFLPGLRAQQQALQDDIRQWQQSGKLNYGETVLYVKQPNKKLKAAIEGGFYKP